MKAIQDTWLIQIEITNACLHRCLHCTRFVGHHPKTYYMDLGFFQKALDSLEGFPGGIGIMGGEPTLHPQFSEICEIFKKRIPSAKRFLWTSGYRWKEYRKIIRETFAENIYYNDHKDDTQKHQPILIAMEDIIDDRTFIRSLIDKCWIQEKWSPSINPNGGFFCEVAAAMDLLFDGPGGYPLEKDWWKKAPKDFEDQIKRYCFCCSAALPLPSFSNRRGNEFASKTNFAKLQACGSLKFNKGQVQIFDQKYTKEQILEWSKGWKPWQYLGKKGGKDLYDLYGPWYGFWITARKKWKKRLKKLGL
ncbi:MAG: radical SAM protein [Candidatus Omnitrophica bacterium]|nr:radical SAM protein [Candidatus Omnitrophota bacterium]